MVFATVQDASGFMWFATDAGVSRFDGHSFMNLTVADGLTDRSVINIAEDSEGRIWFLTMNGRLCFWADGRVQGEKELPDLARFVCPHGWQSFVEDRHGLLWFAGVRSDLLRLDPSGDRDSLWHWPTGNMSVLLDTAGEAFIVSSTRIFRFNERGWRIADPGLSGQIPNPIINQPFSQQQYPMGLAPTGIYRITDNGWQQVIGVNLSEARYERCWTDANDDLWLRRKDGGVELWRNNGVGGFAHSRTLFERTLVNHVHVDTEGNYWLATMREGVLHCNASEFSTALFIDPKISGSAVAQCVIHTRSGCDLVGTANGSVFRIQGDSMKLISDHRLGRVVDMAEDHQGRIWLATDHDCLWLDPSSTGSVIVPILSRSVSDQPQKGLGTKAVEITPDGNVWWSNFGLQQTIRYRGALVRELLPDTIVPARRILALLADQAGRIWYESNDALYCLANGAVRDFPGLKGRTGLRITSLCEWGLDTLLVGTSGAGVLFVSEGRVLASFRSGNGALSNEVLRVHAHGDTLIVATEAGAQIVFNARTLLTGGPLKGSTITDAGKVYDVVLSGENVLLATDRGACRVPLVTRVANSGAPVLHLAGAWLNDSLIDPVGGINMMERTDRLRLSFRAISFSHPGTVRYQYRMRSTEAWNDNVDGMLDLPALAPGDYNVEMRARKTWSDWSVPLALPLMVEASWWNRTYVRVGAVLLLLGAALFLYRWFLLRKHRTELATMQQRQALDQERRRIAADVHDDLGAELSRLMLHARHMEQGSGTANGRTLTDGLSGAVDKIDEIIWSLDPSRDTVQGTVHFVEQIAQETAEANSLAFRTKVRMNESAEPLAAQQRREVMLVAREALRNIVEHAQATTLWLEWYQGPKQLVLSIADDGVGFDPVHEHGVRNGLKNMRERAERLGGELRITRNEPKGVRVELIVPMKWNHPIG
ncbi:MAG: hypothetical protein KA230_08615 [Flavobacteriales bacterium]|nr:hypothetical protein [Flavobacteriales bacterium]